MEADGVTVSTEDFEWQLEPGSGLETGGESVGSRDTGYISSRDTIF
jgi:hypothetical protein